MRETSGMDDKQIVEQHFSSDGSTLLSWSGNTETCYVRDGCRCIGRKAFMYQDTLKRVVLPSSVETLEPFAFSCTGLESFDAPDHLRIIGEKAFYQCKQLHRAHLNEGLLSIGDEAFCCTDLIQLSIPASVNSLGTSIVEKTPIALKNAGEAFRISAQNPNYLTDEQGGLYHKSFNGQRLVEMIANNVTHHRVLEHTTALGSNTYQHCKKLEYVELPEGLRHIGARAFRGCRSLRHVTIPESLESVGDEAFTQSSIEEFYFPAGFNHLGALALTTGDHDNVSTLSSIRVHPLCTRFYTSSGLLCERTRNKHSIVVMYFGPEKRVIVPPEASDIAPYAFAGSRTIQELHIHADMRHVHPQSFFSQNNIECIHIDLDKFVCGRNYVEIHYPTEKYTRPMLSQLFLDGYIDVENLCNYSDRAIYYMHETLGRAQRMLDRLSCPQYLTIHNREQFEEALTRNTLSLCRLFAQRGCTKELTQMVDLGFLNKENIDAVIENISEMGDAAMTAFLLELDRKHFGGRQHDFSL